MFDANSITKVAWGASVLPHLAYLPQIPINPRAAACHIRNKFLRCSHIERLRIPYNWYKPIVKPRVHFWDDDKEGPVTQYFFFKPPVASVCNFSLPIASVSNCLWIACKIPLCINRGC